MNQVCVASGRKCKGGGVLRGRCSCKPWMRRTRISPTWHKSMLEHVVYGIPVRISAGGGTVLVDSSHSREAEVEVATKGIFFLCGRGFIEIFPNGASLGDAMVYKHPP